MLDVRHTNPIEIRMLKVQIPASSFFPCDSGSNHLPVYLILAHLKTEDNSASPLFRAVSEIFMKVFTLHTQGPEEPGP